MNVNNLFSQIENNLTPQFFLSIFAPYVMLYIAIKTYKNHDFKKSLLKEQLLIVSKLANELNNFGLPTYFMLHSGSASNHPRFLDFFKLEGIEQYKLIYFTTRHVNEILPFIDFQHNILIPKKIASAVKSFHADSLSGTLKEELPEKYILILSKMPQEEMDKLKHYYFYMSQEKFREHAFVLVTEIANWLEKYGAKSVNLPEHMLKIK